MCSTRTATSTAAMAASPGVQGREARHPHLRGRLERPELWPRGAVRYDRSRSWPTRAPRSSSHLGLALQQGRNRCATASSAATPRPPVAVVYRQPGRRQRRADLRRPQLLFRRPGPRGRPARVQEHMATVDLPTAQPVAYAPQPEIASVHDALVLASATTCASAASARGHRPLGRD